MLTPSDPPAFRAEVLRRALRVERNRRRSRAVVASAAVLAVILSGSALLASRGGDDVEVTAAAGPAAEARGLRARVLALPDARAPHSVVGDGRSTWILDRGDDRGPRVLRYAEGRLAAVGVLPADATPEQIVAGTDAGLWMTDPAGARVLRVAQDGTVREVAVRATPSGRSVFAGERLWFAEPSSGRLTSVDGTGRIDHQRLPAGASPGVVSLGPDGSVWYADRARASIGGVSPSGAVTTYELATPDERVLTMSPGPGPALWLLIRSDRGLRTGRVDGGGRIVEDDVEPSSADRAITPGPDGRLWFTSGSGAALLRRSITGLETTSLDRPVRATSLALTAEGTIWAVDRDRAVVVELRS